MTGLIEPIVGRYVHVTIDGAVNRIYFEENGTGIPLVCLHTAGSDARQWRHLLTDASFTRNFRIIAFDMPWHGKSNPPEGWNGDEYRLTTARYTETIRAFCRALSLDRPVVMGCSIGGRIVLNLAIDHAPEFRALIGLEAADFQAPWYDTEWLNRPDVHGGEICAALVSGLIAPQSPDAARSETLWGHKQGGPGVFNLFLSGRRRSAWTRCRDRHQPVPVVPADRRIRFLLQAGRYAADRGTHRRRRGRGHGATRPLPDE